MKMETIKHFSLLIVGLFVLVSCGHDHGKVFDMDLDDPFLYGCAEPGIYTVEVKEVSVLASAKQIIACITDVPSLDYTLDRNLKVGVKLILISSEDINVQLSESIRLKIKCYKQYFSGPYAPYSGYVLEKGYYEIVE